MQFLDPDSQFEEAGRDPAQFDKLLQRAQKERRAVRIIALIIVVLLMIPAVWISVILFQVFHHLIAGHFDLATESLKRLPATKVSQPLLIMVAFQLCFAITIVIVMVREANLRVKMLLLFRGLRDAKTPEAPQG